eukprot:scaffold54179_cov29-Prasinocladus_malaysianus.AAC.1
MPLGHAASAAVWASAIIPVLLSWISVPALCSTQSVLACAPVPSDAPQPAARPCSKEAAEV